MKSQFYWENLDLSLWFSSETKLRWQKCFSGGKRIWVGNRKVECTAQYVGEATVTFFIDLCWCVCVCVCSTYFYLWVDWLKSIQTYIWLFNKSFCHHIIHIQVSTGLDSSSYRWRWDYFIEKPERDKTWAQSGCLRLKSFWVSSLEELRIFPRPRTTNILPVFKSGVLYFLIFWL